MNLKPWREVAIPHEDVLKGTFQQAEFAADLTQVHSGTASEEYLKPDLFFKRTFITEGMRLLLDSVIRRLCGKGGDPVIQLQTAFGGGKTHTMLAVYHIASGKCPVSDLQGVSSILDATGLTEIPKAKIAVLDGNNLAPNQPRKRGSVMVNTIWGELAWQLGKEAGYECVRAADESGTSPGKETLIELLQASSPCVILVDELVAYLRQFEDGKVHSGGTFDSNLSFFQALMEALKSVPNSMMLASLPESEKEVGINRGVTALKALEHYFARVQAIWKPVGTDEAFEIVRRRLFSSINDRAASENVCRAFADFYIANGADFPRETQESRYYDRLISAYPIHPEVFSRLYEDWSTLDNFQRTRGVLKLMAKVIYRLWKDDNKDLMIQPGNLPLYDADVRNETIYYLPPGWDPVMERDIDGERAETTEIDSKDTRLGSVQASRRSARTIFLGSAPCTANQMARGIEAEQIMLGCVQPGQQTGIFKDALRRLADRLHYLNSGNNRFWFDVRPNLRREMEERKRRFQDAEHVYPEIRTRLQQSLSSGIFAGNHVFVPHNDVPDDFQLRLVVLPPNSAFSRAGENLAVQKAGEYLKNRGDQPRLKQNRLIFLTADMENVSRLKDQVKSVLAWKTIIDDNREMKLNLDQLQARQAQKSLEDAQDVLNRVVKDTYKWLLAPVQEANGKISEIKWESFMVSSSALNLTQEIGKVLKDNEVLILEWAPIHLKNLLSRWFWKDGAVDAGAIDVWHKSCCYLYMPRLKDESVFQRAVSAGASSRDFFGFAYGKEDDKYMGFSYGNATTPIFDNSLLLIEPVSAGEYEIKTKPVPVPVDDTTTDTDGGNTPPGGGTTTTNTGHGGGGSTPPTTPEDDTPPLPTAPKKKQFYGSLELDPVRAKIDFATIVDEVVQIFTSKHDVKVKISIDIQAESLSGFDENVQRSIRENCNVLRFKSHEFDTGE